MLVAVAVNETGSLNVQFIRACQPHHQSRWLLIVTTALWLSLWHTPNCVAIAILAAMALGHAIKNPTRSRWALYTITLGMGLYTQPAFIWLMLGHGLWQRHRHIYQSQSAYWGCVLLALSLFMPRLSVLIH